MSSKHQHSRLAVAIAALALVSSSVLLPHAAFADPVVLQPGELVVNGGAEQPVTVGWTGPLARATHGVGGYPGSVIVNASGLTGETFDGGLGLFYGSGGVSEATQIIDLSASAPAIDNGEVDALLSAYIGGYTTQADNAAVSYVFRDAGGATLSSVTFGPVLMLDRGGVSGFVPFERTERLPEGTRDVVVTMRMVRSIAPYNDGYVDNVSLVLDAPSPIANPDSTDTGQGLAVTLTPRTNDTPGAGATLVPESVTLLDNGAETLDLTTAEGSYSVDVDGDVTFEPVATFVGTTTPVSYRITDSSGQQAVSTITVRVSPRPVAENDTDLGNTSGTIVTVEALDNDEGALVPASLTLWDPVAGAAIPSPLTVPGEGRWSVETGGVIRFAPETGFFGDPTPVSYRVSDSYGLTDTATVTISYLPRASDDTSSGNTPHSTVTVDVIGNDRGSLDPASVVLVDPVSGARVTTFTVIGEGEWTVDPATGAITFTPESGFVGDPTPVTYEVTDSLGRVTSALVAVEYSALPPPASLAVTGADPAAALATVAAMLAGGAALLWTTRRRRTS